MKIVSLVVFAAALIGSWAAVHAPRPVAESVHADIQSELKTIIAEYIASNLPDSRNLRFKKFWTETIKASQVRAEFVYSFDDKMESGEDATVEIEGSALLNKVAETPDTVTWSFDSLTISDNNVTFNEPIRITAETASPKAQ